MRQLSSILCSIVLSAGAGTAFAAGNVTAVADGFGGLVITGDAMGNSIKVEDDDADDTWDVIGAGGTTVNAGPSASIAVPTGSIVINLGDGDDSLKMKGGSVPLNLSVYMGIGADKAKIQDLTLGTFLHFEGEDGDDKAQITRVAVTDLGDSYYSSIDGDLFGGLGTGTDAIKVKEFSDQDARMSLGDGDDKLLVAKSTLTGGSPYLLVSGDGGTDKILLIANTTGPLTVDTGPGDADLLKIVKSTAASNELTDSAGTGDKLVDKGNTLGAAGLGTPSGFGD
jgi:hypothetical protein